MKISRLSALRMSVLPSLMLASVAMAETHHAVASGVPFAPCHSAHWILEANSFHSMDSGSDGNVDGVLISSGLPNCSEGPPNFSFTWQVPVYDSLDVHCFSRAKCERRMNRLHVENASMGNGGGALATGGQAETSDFECYPICIERSFLGNEAVDGEAMYRFIQFGSSVKCQPGLSDGIHVASGSVVLVNSVISVRERIGPCVYAV